MLLCSQGEVQKVISEQTSGTTGAGKRVFYTEGDCEHTIEPVSYTHLRMCGKGSIKRALVSGDACPQTVMKAIEEILETRLWPHYGSREMGLGGAICLSLIHI